MYKKEQINEFNTYIKKFDRIVLSSSCLQKDKKSNNIINILIKEKKDEKCLIFNHEVMKTGSIVLINKLITNKVVVCDEQDHPYAYNITYNTLIESLSKKKNYKVLFITCNDEDIYYLDYNHNASIVTCDESMSFFENVFSPSKEYIHFNIKTLDSYENIKLVFLIQSNVNNIDNNTNKKIFPLKKINNLYYELTIEKQELFKYDELQFLITNENKKYYSKVMDFYANIDQTWTISLNNNGVLCKTTKDVYDDGISSELIEGESQFLYYGGKTINLPLDQDIDTKAINDSIFFDDKHQKVILTDIKEDFETFEGKEYYTNDDEVNAFLFDNMIPSIHSLTLNTQRKIEYMVRNKINKSSICWPISAIYDNENNFRGYLFKNVEGMNLRDFVYQVKNKDDIGILNQSKTTIIEMILAILDTIVYLHHINVIIGELKLEHIIVSTNNPSKVSFIHCHNYQIGKYPCLNINDTVAPEIDINYKNNYLTYQSDYYQVFSMLFEILFKTLPYTSCNSKFIDNYLNGDFPYSLKEEETIVNGRKGYPVNNWSHIPGYLKKAFWDMGSRKGDHFEPKKRYTPIDWMRLFMSYNSDLNNNRLQNVDESYDKGYFDPSLSPVNYKVVDIPMEKTITFITKGFNLYDTIKKAFINAIIQYNDKSLQKVYDTLCSNPSYECDEYKLLLKKNIGMFYIIELTCNIN